jgi:nucleoid-associated protein YgaU
MTRFALVSSVGAAAAGAVAIAVAYLAAAPALSPRVAALLPARPPAAPSIAPSQDQLAAIAPAAGPKVPTRREVAPSFDVVRVGPGGDAVIAGRAAPGAEVRVSDGATLLGAARADARGEWVIVPEKKIEPGERQLSLVAIQPGSGEAVKAEAEVVLSVPKRETGAATSLAVLLPTRPEGGARALQLPGDKAGPGNALGLEVVEYDAAGQVALSGHGTPGSRVQLYLDDKPLAAAEVGPDGRWTARPEGAVASGRHTLRLDELGAAGKVASRLAVPFQRAEPPPNAGPGEWVTVQPGHSLWRIARQTYGSGLRYAEVYAANTQQIADPDLIYPGQIFKLPAH